MPQSPQSVPDHGVVMGLAVVYMHGRVETARFGLLSKYDSSRAKSTVGAASVGVRAQPAVVADAVVGARRRPHRTLEFDRLEKS